MLQLQEIEAAQERIANDLVRHMIDMETDQFESTITKYIQVNGIRKNSERNCISFPGAYQVLLWQTGHIMPWRTKSIFLYRYHPSKKLMAADRQCHSPSA